MEPFGTILGRLQAKLGGLGAAFGTLRFLIKKGAQREAFWEPNGAKIYLKRGADSRAKKSLLGGVLVRFWIDFQRVLWSKIVFFLNMF